MQTKSLIELLRKLADLGEISRLLSVFAARNVTSCPKNALLEFINQTAGIGPRLPKAEESIEAALHLGLLKKRANVFELTPIGQEYPKSSANAITNLNSSQANLLFGLLFDDPELRHYAETLFSRFDRHNGKDLRLAPSQFDSEQALTDTATILNQLGVLIYQEGFFRFNKAFQGAVSEEMIVKVSINEEELWAKLDETRVRAREVEKAVLREEKKRVALSRPDLADAVIRVSALDPGIGFDIQSFNTDASARYIEVKSSTGNRVRFQWTANEKMKAKNLGPQYWIYFVPLSHMLPKNYCPVLMIQDPFALIEMGRFTEMPASYFVQSGADFAINRVFKFTESHSMFDFKNVKTP